MPGGFLGRVGLGRALITGGLGSFVVVPGTASTAGAAAAAAVGLRARPGTATTSGAASLTCVGLLVHAGVAPALGASASSCSGLLVHAGVALAAGTTAPSCSAVLVHTGLASAPGTGTATCVGAVALPSLAPSSASSLAQAGGVLALPGTATAAGVALAEAHGRVVHVALGRLLLHARPTAQLCATLRPTATLDLRARPTATLLITARPKEPTMPPPLDDWQTTWEIGSEGEFGAETRDARVQPEARKDPTLLRALVLDPDKIETIYTWPAGPEVVRDGLGLFHLDMTITKGGTWTIRWEATGALVVAKERTLTAKRSAFYP